MKVKQRETKLPLDIPILIFENSTHWENKFKWILVVFFVIREYIGAFSLRSRLHFIKNQPHRITKCNVKDASFKILRLATEYPDCENYFGSLILWIINTWGVFWPSVKFSSPISVACNPLRQQRAVRASPLWVRAVSVGRELWWLQHPDPDHVPGPLL